MKQKFTPLDGNRTNFVQTSWAMLGLTYGGQVSILVFNDKFTYVKLV